MSKQRANLRRPVLRGKLVPNPHRFAAVQQFGALGGKVCTKRGARA
jgi:hypothetical protein